MNFVSGEVENLSVGTSGGEQFPATDVAKVVYNEDVVKNIDTDEFDEENITTTVTVTMVAIIDGEEGTEETILPKGYVLTEEEIEELESLEEYFNEYFEEEGLDYVFKGFYLDKDGKEEVDFAEALDEDITWYILFEEKAEELPPKTGDLNLVLLIGTILVGIAGVAVVSKKRFAKGN